MTSADPIEMQTHIDHWPMTHPFRITGYTFDAVETLVVTLSCNGRTGRGEAAGLYYTNELPAVMQTQVEAVRAAVEAGVTREALCRLLPAGGARNALDCALWDLECKLAGRPVWQLAGLDQPRPLLTTFTCGADEPYAMVDAAKALANAKALKLKLTGEPIDADRVRAVREARPEVWLCVDANQGFSRPFLERLMPVLVEAQVGLIEQPLPVGMEDALAGLRSPIPIVADESVQGVADIAALVGRFDGINIKLDKCGGLTQGLQMARVARELGLQTMVGNMIASSLAFAPAFLVGQICDVVDLDSPAFLKVDRPQRVRYVDGFIDCPENVWGYPG